jgi:hypothetical protein
MNRNRLISVACVAGIIVALIMVTTTRVQNVASASSTPMMGPPAPEYPDPAPPPQLLQRREYRGDDAVHAVPGISPYEAKMNQQFPTFAQVPLPPVPQGSGWTWTYHGSYWGEDGCLYDVVSFGGARYHMVACCPEPTMSFPCPDN